MEFHLSHSSWRMKIVEKKNRAYQRRSSNQTMITNVMKVFTTKQKLTKADLISIGRWLNPLKAKEKVVA